ncbi:acyltransferase [Bifidobacterium tissieri]|uniref:Acyltransferase n=1 Tax=Bifidobacterium tissieri TaxID=1630162 RepID=A0A261FJS6_9BIFI|nr:acyltransferase [Bifidobacterium tissieri]KAA8827012.1 acyltransferase [Bifidobacterium tissieri]OZG59420.1 transferase hexapeptide repeat containing protein [Bifidobacterium tissieri]
MIMDLLCKLTAGPNRLKWLLLSRTLRSIAKGSHVRSGFEIKGARYISIGECFSAGRFVSLQVWKGSTVSDPELVIGDRVVIADFGFVSCASRVSIGDGTLMGVNAFITDNSHGGMSSAELHIPPNERDIQSKGPVVIGKNVWIGRNVCILPGVTIGDGAVIGANAVVTHDVPAYAVAAGVPAQIVKRFDIA